MYSFNNQPLLKSGHLLLHLLFYIGIEQVFRDLTYIYYYLN